MSFKIGDRVRIKNKLSFVSSDAPDALREWALNRDNDFIIKNMEGTGVIKNNAIYVVDVNGARHTSFFYAAELELATQEWD